MNQFGHAMRDSIASEALPAGEGVLPLLRFVDRAALDQLVASFADAIRVQAAILTLQGEILAGAEPTCPVCGALATYPTGEEPWIERPTMAACGHGLTRAIEPIRLRDGTMLGLAVVGPFVSANPKANGSSRALTVDSPKAAKARMTMEEARQLGAKQAESAASLLAQTIGSIAREAAVASEHVELVARQRQANREMAVLYAVAQALSSGFELENILQRLVDTVADALSIEVVSVALVEGQHLVNRVSRGYATTDARLSRLKLGEGFAGRVASSGEPMMCSDMQADPRQSTTAINARENLHAFAGAPIKLQGSAIGVLSLYRRTPYRFSDDELRILAHIADQASVAVERAQLYQMEHNSVGQLRGLHAQVESQRQALERAAAIHDQLTKMVLEDFGLQAIVDTVARLLCGGVGVEDRFLHLLAAAPSDTTGTNGAESFKWRDSRDYLTHPEVRRAMDAVAGRRRPVLLPPIPEIGLDHQRVIAPIVAGSDLLGYLSVIEGRPLGEEDFRAIEHASTVVALEMMKQRTEAEVERRLRGDLLDELISNKEISDFEELRRRAAYLGYDVETPHALFVFEAHDRLTNEDADATNAEHARNILAAATDAITSALNRLGRAYLAATRGGALVIATPLLADTLTEARSLADSLWQEALRHVKSVDLSVGIGRICRSAQDFAIAFAEARRAIGLVYTLGGSGKVIAYDDLGVYRLLLDLPRHAEAFSFAERVLAAIVENDSRHGQNLLGTLETYLAHNCVAQKAAESLGIHVNTLSYRLQRIRDLTGKDINNSETRLEMQLAVKIRQTAPLVSG